MGKVALPDLRYYAGLDALRAILMLVGVFWHAVCVIVPNGNFVYNSSLHENAFLYRLIYPEHIFRMETFFLISGFLSQRVLMSKPKMYFAKMRVKRVLVPLVLACFLLNLGLQIWGNYVLDYRWENFDIWRMVMHGWFLISLFLFAGIDIAIVRSFWLKQSALAIFFVFLLGGVGYIALVYMNGHFWHLWGNKGTLFNFFVLHSVQYYPSYFLGGLLFYRQDFLDNITKRTVLLIATLALISASLEYAYVIFKIDPWGDGFDSGLLDRINHMIAANGIAFLLFLWCYRMRFAKGKIISYLIRSAIVIYLVHHPLVVIFGHYVDRPALGSASYYFLLLVLTFAFSFLAYEMINRSALLCFVFGMKPLKKGDKS